MTKPKQPRNQQPERDVEELIQFLLPKRFERLESVLSNRSAHLTVVLDGVHNYHNISAVIRSADAFGLRDIHLVGDTFDYSRGISLGAEQWVQIHRHTTSLDAAHALKELGFRLVITAPEEYAVAAGYPSVPVYQLPFSEKLALVFGNERRGVSADLMQAATLSTFIPMFGFVESFNISVACAICLFCSSLTRQESKQILPPLTPEDAADLRAKWLKKNVRNSDAILREIKRRST